MACGYRCPNWDLAGDNRPRDGTAAAPSTTAVAAAGRLSTPAVHKLAALTSPNAVIPSFHRSYYDY